MTHTGSFLLKSTGFNIGYRIAIALMLWKHLSSSGVHWKVWLFCTDPDNGVVYAIISGMYSARYCTTPRNFWICYNFREFSIPWFATFYPTWHVCHCCQWHVPDSRSCLRISQVLTLINKIATLWVIGALSLCAICSWMLWEYMNISSIYMCMNLSRNSWNTAVINCWNVEGALQSPICITQLWQVWNTVENVVLQTSSVLMCICS